MKRLFSAVLGASALAVSAAFAGPIALPTNSPLFLQYTNAEQISPTNQIQAPGGPLEGNWGIVQLSNIVRGTALNPIGSDIQGGGTPVFVDQVLPLGAQVLGIFYGANFIQDGTGQRASGGRLDLYWWDGHTAQNTGTELNNAANLAKRTAQNEYTGFTCASGNTAQCTFLASYTFQSGANPGDPATTIFSTNNPAVQDGTSKSYLSLDTTKVGAWTAQLDTNFFTLDPCNNPVGYNYAAGGETCAVGGGTTYVTGGVSMPKAEDLRLDNNFSRNGATAWDQLAANGSPIIGLRSNDPARTYSQGVPEPATLALLGASLLGLGAVRRSRRS